MHHQVFADGVGGTYTNDTLGGGTCYLPNGFAISYGGGTYDLNWEGCSSGPQTTYGAYTSWSGSYADGAGGVIYNSGSDWAYPYYDGYFIYDDGMSCRVRLTSPGSYTTENYGGYDPYGTKIGTPYWDSGNSAVYQTIADGSGGTLNIPWDGYAPYPAYGTQLYTPSYNCGYYNDANNQSWYVCMYTYTLADGNGSSYTQDSIDGNYPNGWALTSSGVLTSEYDYMWYVYDTGMNYIYPWRYGYQAADGMGGTYTNYGSAPYYTILSPYFDEYYYGGGYIYADGNGGYFFGTSSPP
jgi:hypothetical protein